MAGIIRVICDFVGLRVHAAPNNSEREHGFQPFQVIGLSNGEYAGPYFSSGVHNYFLKDRAPAQQLNGV